MSSGDTLIIFTPLSNEPPSSNYATLGLRNLHPILQFDTTTQEAAIWTGICPRSYSGGGITVYVHWDAATATSGTIGWDVAFEYMSDGSTDMDSDSFASAQTIVAATVPGTSGIITITNVAISNGANIDNLAVGGSFRIRVRRDVSNDTATGDANLYAVELKET